MNFTYKEEAPQTGTYNLNGNLIGEKDGLPITESFAEKLEEGVRYFVINLEKLQHINSAGLGVLITLLTKARKNDGEVVLANPSSYIQNLLVITKLNSIFKIFDDTETALGTLQS
ncbi:MAG: STAS domain-containing protein [Bacteroidia bacterium]|nr:STAS domain-containing protein [Bacteroidia bacterium]